MVISSNLLAMNSERYIGIVNTSVGKRTEKLASGYKINRSADDAAGLAISEKMRRQIKGLTRATENAQDGVSFCQTADGALDELHEMLRRVKGLAIQASNDTNSPKDREYLQQEVSALFDEMDRVHTTTVFNETNIFLVNEGGFYWCDGVGANGKLHNEAPKANADLIAMQNEESSTINIEWEFTGTDGAKDSVAGAAASGGVNPASVADSDMAKFVQKAAATAIDKLGSLYPNLFAKSSSNNIKVGLNLAPMDGPGGTLASATLGMSYNSVDSTKMKYTLNVDTTDYGVSDFASMTDAQKADLAATIAHEMTHLVMYDTVTKGMLSGTTESFPKWFVEGMAQTSSGDNGWVSGALNASSSDDDVKGYMGQLYGLPYGAGYLATMALGAAAGGGNDSSSIAKGLDKILTSVASGDSLDTAIKKNTSYTGLADFEDKFTKGDATTLGNVKNILANRGSGAGSLFGALSTPEATVFAPASQTGTNLNYAIDRTNTEFTNAFNDGFAPAPKGDNGSNEGKDGGGAGGGAGGGTPIEPDKKAKILELGKGISKEVVFGGPLYLQVGAERGQTIGLLRFDVSTFGLFMNGTYNGATDDFIDEYKEVLDVSTVEQASKTLGYIDRASEKISSIRAYYGATQNRLEHTIKNLDNVIENTTAAESAIRDTDMAKEIVGLSNEQIILQAGVSMLAQANQKQQNVLTLLG